jgi:hypothetical protein
MEATTMLIQHLPEHVKKKGKHYFLIERTETTALYQYGNPCTGYEVFYIKKFDAKKSAARWGKQTEYDIKESYPNDEDFGKTAWYYPDLITARKSYLNLLPR